MEVSHTKKSTRIIILVIAIVMAGGFAGSYFLIILNNNDRSANAANQSQTQDIADATKPTGQVDKTAFKVEGKVEALQIVDEVTGTGAEVKAGDTVTVHYKGTLATTGVKFDSSYDRGEPITFSLSQVIEGWQKGIPGMKIGGKRRLVIPSSMAYGPSGTHGIPPNSDLVFEVELFAVNPSK
jgi:FKBP-type peptidyl-prolyl cis-trans isomerase